jgi:hypothetical protein
MSVEQSQPTVAESNKKTAEQLASENGLKIFNAGKVQGKTESKGESRDPRRKKLGRSVDTVSKARANGKNKDFKSIKTAFNALDDDRDNFSKAKTLLENCMNYFDQLEVPVKIPNPPPQQPEQNTV